LFWVVESVDNPIKFNVRVCAALTPEVTSKIKQLEVEGARAPVPRSWRRQCLCFLVDFYTFVAMERGMNILYRKVTCVYTLPDKTKTHKTVHYEVKLLSQHFIT